MSTAQYLPVCCAVCGRAQLHSVLPGDVPKCRTCGIPTSVLPGQTYVAGDAALFERIQAAVLTTPLARRSAERVEKELRDVAIRGDAPENGLAARARPPTWPALLAASPAAAAEPGLGAGAVVARHRHGADHRGGPGQLRPALPRARRLKGRSRSC